jgi:hypothetical protein
LRGMETSKQCLQCPELLLPGRRKFCSHKCAMDWHNARQVWSERADRERHNARKKNRYWEDPEAARARMQEWRENHPDLQKAIERRNKIKMVAEIKASNEAWRERNREELKVRSGLVYYRTRKNTPWKHILRARMRDALKRGIPFELTPEWAEARWTGRCEISDIPFDLNNIAAGFYSPSIDKIVPELGYLPDNSRFVLLAVNCFKHVGTDADLLKTAQAIVNAQLKRATLEVEAPKTTHTLSSDDVVTAHHDALLADLTERHQ